VKPRDFKLLATLPEGYDYRLFDNYINNQIMVIGANQDKGIIGFFIHNDELLPMNIEENK